MRADQIAAATGLSETCVLAQLAHALLIPAADTIRATTPNPGGINCADAGGADRPPAPNSGGGQPAGAISGFRPPAPYPGRLHPVDTIVTAGADSPPADTHEGLRLAGGGPTANALVLDPSQEQAAQVPAGPVLVDAGPGTGKTRTLTARIVHLLRDRGVAPGNIAALTFSNRAAEEMTDRLLATAGDAANCVWIGTFHAFGFELLRKEGQRIGLTTRSELLETADAVTLLERHFDLLNLTEYEYLNNPTLPLADILSAISRAKDELKGPEEYQRAADAMAASAQSDAERTEAAKAAEVAHVYAVYQRLLGKFGLVDFGDLIARAVELLEAHPDVRERWQRQYPHILADEYQDVNRATARLLQLLAGDGNGFWAVGDLRQAIYRFRGASPANIRRFETDFPGGFRPSLDYNYRSMPGLVRLFGGMARRMASGTGSQDSWSAIRSNADLPEVTLAVADDEAAQADWLAEQISAARGA